MSAAATESGVQTETSQERIESSKDTAYSLKSALAEFLQFTSPRILVVSAIAFGVARLTMGDWSLWDLAIMAAILAFWPFQEWLIHVLVLHFKPRKVLGIKIDPNVPKKHRMHHQDPWNMRYTFIPLDGLFFMLGLNLLLWNLVMPTRALAFTGLAFFTLMGLMYEWTHYLVHSRYRARSKFYKKIWRSHRLHHCKNENYWYGVSMLLGDRVLGTAPDPKEVENSHTCRTLEG